MITVSLQFKDRQPVSQQLPKLSMQEACDKIIKTATHLMLEMSHNEHASVIVDQTNSGNTVKVSVKGNSANGLAETYFDAVLNCDGKI